MQFVAILKYGIIYATVLKQASTTEVGVIRPFFKKKTNTMHTHVTNSVYKDY
jgi:hypothetical protein